MRTFALAALALALVGCAPIPPAETYEAKPLAAGDLQAAREKALRIYDLDAPEWSSTLTAGQLRNGFARRLNAELDEDGRRVLRTFIEGELALR